MAEDSGNSPTRKPSSNSAGSGGANVNNTPGKSTPASLPPAPSGFHPVRRSMTVDDSPQLRHRPTSGQTSFDRSFDSPLRRRSSTFSDYSLSEARRNIRDDILNPSGAGLEHASSDWAWLPLAFALLPAVGGLFFKNGSSLITDILLLGLAAVFLHWSVTQPWFVSSGSPTAVRPADTKHSIQDLVSLRPGGACERGDHERAGD